MIENEPEPEVLDRLRAVLTEAGIAFTETHHKPVYTSAEAAEVRGVSLHSGAKALIVKANEEQMMIVLPADLSLDSNGLRKLLKCKRLRFATREEVETITGLTPGAIPPFGSLFGLPTMCDETLAENERINFNAGSHSDSFQMQFKDFALFESPRIAKVAKPAD